MAAPIRDAAPSASAARLTSPRSAWILLAGDVLCLALFIGLGLRQHELLDTGRGLARFALDFGAMALAWGLAGAALRAFRFPAPVRLPVVWQRTLLAWLLAAPYALLLRAVILRAATMVVIFVLITLGLGGALLLAWRTLYFGLLWGLHPEKK